MAVFSRSCLGYPLRAELTLLDEGLLCAVTGGVRTHVGAVTLQDPGEEPRTLVRPGHKDHFVSEPWARALCDAFRCPVTVTCGIHYDEATPEEIREILAAAEALLDAVLSARDGN